MNVVIGKPTRVFRPLAMRVTCGKEATNLWSAGCSRCTVQFIVTVIASGDEGGPSDKIINLPGENHRISSPDKVYSKRLVGFTLNTTDCQFLDVCVPSTAVRLFKACKPEPTSIFGSFKKATTYPPEVLVATCVWTSNVSAIYLIRWKSDACTLSLDAIPGVMI